MFKLVDDLCTRYSYTLAGQIRVYSAYIHPLIYSLFVQLR